MTSRALLSAAVAFGLATSLVTVVPAANAADNDSTTDVTVLLKAPDASGLRTLAKRKGLTRSERRSRLQPLLPQTDDRSDVVDELEGAGFTVTGVDTWTITATAPSQTVTDTLGTLTASGDLSNSDSLGSSVASVVTEQSEPDLRPLASTSGADYRNAYAPAGSSASTGSKDSANTVATIQLSDWNNADLTYYATKVLGVTDPVASGQYSEYDVDGGTSDTSGSGEVDLDQESILATAPSARQRAYIAPNSLAGFADAYSAVASEAASRATTAVSVSWGGCESTWSSAAIKTMENVIASVNAAGVTAFSSSGDAGIYDCGTGSTTATVDYPASSSQVVAVGGTALSSTTSPSTANTGSNWKETGWSCTNLVSCTNTSGGSGGGASAKFSKPSWQDSLTGSYGSSTARLVPDVAAVGDPSTGFVVYTSNGRRSTYGGTSLSSPVAAASFANALGDAGASSHPGDIHEALYEAHTEDAASVFRDVTTGQNGATLDRASDPSVSATTGYDTVSGLGSVYWPELLPYLGITTTSDDQSGTSDIPTSATPTISGASRVGSKLTAVPGTWTSGTTFTYRWVAGGTLVSTAATWTPTAAHRGRSLQLTVTGHMEGYADTARSSATTTIAAGQLTSSRPTVSGTRRVGRTLRVNRGGWTAGTTLTQVWYVGGRARSSATSLELTRSMRGKRVEVQVTGRKAGYTTVTRSSAATAKVRHR